LPCFDFTASKVVVAKTSSVPELGLYLRVNVIVPLSSLKSVNLIVLLFQAAVIVDVVKVI
jgi:hypothetical protein